MMVCESAVSLSVDQRLAVVDLLYRMADDELVIGHRNSEWTGLGPILEEDIAFSSMAQDEIGHAQAYYALLHQLGERDPDTLAFGRGPREFRCAGLCSMPNNRDWALCIVRQFLYDYAETVRLSALSDSSFTPLAQLTSKLRSEEKYHLLHGRTWMLRLGNSTEEARRRLQTALDATYAHALGLFEPTEADEPLAQSGIAPREQDLRCRWESAIAPVLADARLSIPHSPHPVYGGRVGRHPESLTAMLHDMQSVYRLDPAAQW